MQAGQWAFLWDNPMWADFALEVYAADERPGARPLYVLQLQSTVLAIASPGHLQQHCARLRAQGAHQAPPRGRPWFQFWRPRTQRAYSYKLVLEPGEPQGIPRAVLCHLHTGQLPDDPEQLIWIMRRADYLDLAETLKAALRKLLSVDSKQLTLQHAGLLIAYPHYQCDTPRPQAKAEPAAGDTAPQGLPPLPVRHAAAAAVVTVAPAAAPRAGKAVHTAAAAAAAKATFALYTKVIDQVNTLINTLLTTYLPSAPAIVTHAALLAQFTQLPLALIKRWVELDKYEIDSGNTLAVLFTAWHDAQPEPPTEEQCAQLSALLPLAAVSLCYHIGALQHLRWWREPHVPPCGALVAHTLAHRPGPFHGTWTSKVGGAHVAKRATKSTTHTWTVSKPQLKHLWEVHALTLPSFYHAGAYNTLRLTLTHKKTDPEKAQGLFLSLHRVVVWPGVISKHLAQAGASAPTKPAELLTATNYIDVPGSKRWQDKTHFHADTWGWECIESLPVGSLEVLTAGPVTVSMELSQPM